MSIYDIFSKRTIDSMKNKNFIKDSSELPTQVLSPLNLILINGKEYSINNLEKISVTAPGFSIKIDGKDLNGFKAANLYRGNNNGADIFLVKDVDENIEFINVRNQDFDADIISLNSYGIMRDRYFATIMADDYDDEKFKKKFSYEEIKNKDDDIDIDYTNRGILSQHTGRMQMNRKHSQAYHPITEDCSEYKVIEVAIAYDSKYCSALGGSTEANNRIQLIVALASQIYEVPGLCTKISISHIEGYCNIDTDPLQDILKLGNTRPIWKFRKLWKENKSEIHRDTAHWFTGSDFDGPSGNTIGYAFIRQLCSRNGSYGMEWMTFTVSRRLQSHIFAHELGHNAGASHHVNDCSSCVMAPRINRSLTKQFSLTSIAEMKEYMAKASCIETVNSQSTTGSVPSNYPSISQKPSHGYPCRPWCSKRRKTNTCEMINYCAGCPHCTFNPQPMVLLSQQPNIYSHPSQSFKPSMLPTKYPTLSPSQDLSAPPSSLSSSEPSNNPSFLPSSVQTILSNQTPTAKPTASPPFQPNNKPSYSPLFIPSRSPSKYPIFVPPQILLTANPSSSVKLEYFVIKSRLSMRNKQWCIGLSSPNISNGNRARLRSCNGTPAQEWVSDQYGYIRNRMNNDMCLIPIGGKSEKGTPLWLWQCDDRYSISWHFNPDGYIDFGAGSGLVIGVAIGNVSNGGRIELLSKVKNAKDQRWKKWLLKTVQ